MTGFPLEDWCGLVDLAAELNGAGGRARDQAGASAGEKRMRALLDCADGQCSASCRAFIVMRRNGASHGVITALSFNRPDVVSAIP